MLLFIDPAYNFTIPFGALTSPFSETIISPPPAVLILLFFPAFKTMEPVYPVVVFSEEFEEIGSFRAISPVSVSTNTGPEEYIPVGFTDPISKPPLTSVKFNPDILEVLLPPAITFTLFDALVRWKKANP